MAGTTPVLVHNCNGQIDYNSTDLSHAAYKARFKAGVSPGRNVAAARVDGLDEPVIGFSKGGGYHSENHILDQLAEKGIDPSRITELYSERQPCSKCGPLLDSVLSPGTPVSWSVPWGDNAIINRGSNELLRQMIAAAGGR
ncbi:nucleic acid/nucleotide deaminase domain-containing protein [Actinacidiphila paucisporea]|uniref:nucleic acid/nucleotide deaminase domain-containing protein n=1 Tax=Actinacidiphila paucisporea TaxID=310782 RepID=UPI0009A0D245